MGRRNGMNKEWLDCLMEMPMLEYDSFKEATTLQSKILLSKKFLDNDYSWLNVIEKYLPFLRNTLESISPLVSEEVEARKNYENRFLYTLFCRLNQFLQMQKSRLEKQELASNQSVLNISGTTPLESEEVSFSLQLTITKKEVEKRKNTVESAKERLSLAISFLEPLQNCLFVQVMKESSFIRFPIRRTGLLVTHENYKKLLELSEFLDSYEMLEKTLDVKEKKQEKVNFLIPYFMFYQLFSESNIFIDKDEEFLKKYLEGFIRQFVEEGSTDEKSFKKMINKIFEEEYAKKKNREKNIQQVFAKSIDNYQKQVKDAIRALKG